ncbi:hypothetical protein [Niallia sp. 03091]
MIVKVSSIYLKVLEGYRVLASIAHFDLDVTDKKVVVKSISV